MSPDLGVASLAFAAACLVARAAEDAVRRILLIRTMVRTPRWTRACKGGSEKTVDGAAGVLQDVAVSGGSGTVGLGRCLGTEVAKPGFRARSGGELPVRDGPVRASVAWMSGLMGFREPGGVHHCSRSSGRLCRIKLPASSSPIASSRLHDLRHVHATMLLAANARSWSLVGESVGKTPVREVPNRGLWCSPAWFRSRSSRFKVSRAADYPTGDRGLRRNSLP